MNTAIKVILFGNTVGFLSWNEKRNRAVFEYEKEFIKSGVDFAPLTMPLHSVRSQRGLPWEGLTEKLFMGLPSAFADSLPDKWGTSLFDKWLIANSISPKEVSPLDHLAFIGKRAMGALEYEPAIKLGDNTSNNIDVEQLYIYAQHILNEKETTFLNKDESILWQDLIRIGTSAGGKRPKAIVAINDKTGQTMSGQGVIPDGFTHYILKYDDNGGFPYAKMEFVYYLMARAAGINMMPSKLQQYGNVHHFLTERFDRIGNKKIHTQTLAAMQPLSDSYSDAIAVLRKLDCPYSDYIQLYKTMVFNVFGGNIDDHSKNISFLMSENGKWRLAPAYDLNFCLDTSGLNIYNRHELSILGENRNITKELLIIFGERNDIRDCKHIVEEIYDIISHIELYAKEVNVDDSYIHLVKKSLGLIR